MREIKIEGEVRYSPRAQVYTAGTRTIHLIPLDSALWMPVRNRIRALVGAMVKEADDAKGADVKEQVELRAGTPVDAVESYCVDLEGALEAFAAWDEPGIDWEVGLDPEDVMTLKGEPLLAAAEACRAALLRPSVARLGLSSSGVIVAGLRSARGLVDAAAGDAPKGEAAPVES